MRFNEFKLVLTEDAAKFYTIGDSHAVAVATAGGKDWINLAIGGKSSTDAGMLANIAKVPKGATVLVSQGANDTMNAISSAMRANKFPAGLKDPEIIADSVANVVTKVQAQGATVIFLLFPNGPGRGLGGNVIPYQDKVRDAIKNAIGSVQVIDITGKPLTDGIHATMAVYKDVANQVKAKGGITLGPAGATPGAPTTKDKQDPANNMKPGEDKMAHAAATQSLSVPTGNINPAVADIQKVLLALGYKLPKHGVDGSRGPETRNAVKQFQRDNGLKVDGDPGPETIGAMNRLIATKKIAFVKSTLADVKVSAGAGQASGTLPPLKMDSATSGKVGDLLDFIARYESNGDYNIMVGSKRGNLTGMTVAEILDMQKNMIAKGHESTAVGRYQYIRKTLADTAAQMKMDVNGTKFNEKTQDALAIQTLRTIGLENWLAGNLDDGTFLNKVAQVWASIPKTSGKSAHAGVGSNKAGVGANVALNTLQDIRTA
jgi:peptidoglycan hydrolase-like protein with peptidoglycan-binding domain